MKKVYKFLIFTILIIVINVTVSYADTTYSIDGDPDNMKVKDKIEIRINHGENTNSCNIIGHSSNEKIAKVSSTGSNKVTIKAVKAGKATITITVTYYTRSGGKSSESSKSIEVTVTEKIPEEEAKAADIANFWKDHKETDDTVWNKISTTTITKWLETLGKAKDSKKIIENTKKGLNDILDNKKNSEKAEQEKIIENGEEILNNLDNAHMTIPSADADAEEINIFIKSESSKSGSKFKNKEIDKETANKWYETLDKAQIDNISRLNYQPQKDVLNEYINCLNEKDNNLDDRIKKSAEAAKATADANNQAIKNAKIKLAAIAGSSGTSRTENVFKDDVLDNVNSYNPSDSSSTDDSEAATIISDILSAITSVGTVVAVVMLAILGVKYMLGSVEEKAEYKKDLIPYFIGSILLFGICTIVKMLQTLGNSINNL